jgi:hypothetical protein
MWLPGHDRAGAQAAERLRVDGRSVTAMLPVFGAVWAARTRTSRSRTARARANPQNKTGIDIGVNVAYGPVRETIT